MIFSKIKEGGTGEKCGSLPQIVGDEEDERLKTENLYGFPVAAGIHFVTVLSINFMPNIMLANFSPCFIIYY